MATHPSVYGQHKTDVMVKPKTKKQTKRTQSWVVREGGWILEELGKLDEYDQNAFYQILNKKLDKRILTREYFK